MRWPRSGTLGAEVALDRLWLPAPAAPVSILEAARTLHPANARKAWRGRAKFIVRAALHLGLTRTWLSRLGRHPAGSLWQVRPRLASKLQRPYVHRNWTVADRLTALESHYEVIGSLISGEALDEIYRRGLTLLRLEAVGGRALQIRLLYADQFEKEGELTLAIVDDQTGLELATLTFCLVEADGNRAIWIGGLQANPALQTRFLINEVAKEMHGLRPKALALWCLRQLAQAWGIDRLRAIADDHHIYRHSHKRRSFAACYDEFWAESCGLRQSDGWELPLDVAERPAEEIKASRRKAHARRYAMLNDLAQTLAHAIATLPVARSATAPTFTYTPARTSKGTGTTTPGSTATTAEASAPVAIPAPSASESDAELTAA